MLLYYTPAKGQNGLMTSFEYLLFGGALLLLVSILASKVSSRLGVPALLLFSLLSGAVTFWLSPVLHFWSRRFEYQADAFAAETLGQPEPLIYALRKLHEKNLSNLTPHPVYSAFYYSHPTQLEREQALRWGTGFAAGTPAPN